MILNPTTVDEIALNREEWAAALESERYQQAQQTLHATYPIESFCCLGVACDISGIGAWIDEEYRWMPSPAAKYEDCVAGDWDSDDGRVFYRAFGISSDQETDLIRANDDGVPFTEIAAMLRALPLPETVTP